ncbi:MAG: hypothetical protein QNK05_25855 [Myxococcota bacterium]|nr:hypothetical protein [Myxococcota bacterium]
MQVAEARERARRWVAREAAPRPGFVGAFLSGSTKWSPPEAAHPPSSDVDVRVVFERLDAPVTWEKSLEEGLLIEGSAIALGQLGSGEALAHDPYLGGSLWHPVLLADPRGELDALARVVTREFPKRALVEERAGQMRALLLDWLGRIERAPTYTTQVTCWLFGTSVSTLVLLASGLRNLTVKKRYVACRALLAEHGRLDFHEEMLGWLGCAGMPASRVRTHFEAASRAFDASTPYLDPGFRFVADLRPEARPIAIGSIGEGIEAGHHRELVFWLVSTLSRCLQAHTADTPSSVREPCEQAFAEVVGDLGITGLDDLRARARSLRDVLPRLEDLASEIRRETPDIVG